MFSFPAYKHEVVSIFSVSRVKIVNRISFACSRLLHAANVDRVRRLLYTAEGAYQLGKFDESKTRYQEVLQIDPFNQAARRGMERVAAEKSRYAGAAYDHTRAEMLEKVDKEWELSGRGKRLSHMLAGRNSEKRLG